MSDKLSEDEKRKILCEIQLLKVDNPKITGDEIAFKLNEKGFRRAKGKLWNKGTIGHLIKEGENKSDMLNPTTAPVEKFELSEEMEKEINLVPEIKQEKSLIQSSFESRVNLIVSTAIDMNLEWKKCLERNSAIQLLFDQETDQKEEFKTAVTNAIYWNKDCQDLDFNKSWVYTNVLGFKTYQDMLSVIIPKKIKCLGASDCPNQVLIKDRQDLTKNKCKHHQWWFDYNNYMNSDEWKEKSRKIQERDGHACRNCNGTENLRVHHRTYERLGNELDNDLSTICKKCDSVIEPIRKEVAKIKRQDSQEFKKKVS